MSAEPPPSSATPDLVERLMQLIEEASGHSIVVDRSDVGPGSIGRLRVSSSVMIAYLVAIEDELSFVWEDWMPPGVLDSFEALAKFLRSRLPDAGEPC